MGKRTDLKKAAEVIEKAMRSFVGDQEHEQIHVVESSPGHLRVIVGSSRFKDVGIVERQDMVWEHLNGRVDKDSLRFCWGIHPMDLEEYYEEHFPQDTSSSAYPGVGD